MAYYDRIAKSWHEHTGRRGGPFKRHVLNAHLLSEIEEISGRRILELGTGNGYFARVLLERFSGQQPERLVLTDISTRMLDYAKQNVKFPNAEFRQLDVRRAFPFEAGDFDIVLATMVFNEVDTGGFERALFECRRILAPRGFVLVTLTHPAFIADLERRGALRRDNHGHTTMPGAGNLRVPVVKRSLAHIRGMFERAGFCCREAELTPNDRVLRKKPGLRKAHGLPIAWCCVATTNA